MAGRAAQPDHSRVIGVEEGIAASIRVASNNIGRVGAVEVLVGIRLEIDRIDKIAIGIHVGRRKRIAAKQANECAVEMGEVGTIAAPVQRVLPVQASECLRRHRPLHGVEDGISGQIEGW